MEACPVCLVDVPVVPIKLTCCSTQDSQHHVCMLCLKSSLMNNRDTCPLCNTTMSRELIREIHTASIDSPETRDDAGDGSEIVFKWLYSGKNSGWWEFTSDDQETLEKGFSDFSQDPTKDKISMSICGNTYEIDFDNMKQCRTGYSSCTRDIRRIQNVNEVNLIKGVAGASYRRPVQSAPVIADTSDTQSTPDSQTAN